MKLSEAKQRLSGWAYEQIERAYTDPENSSARPSPNVERTPRRLTMEKVSHPLFTTKVRIRCHSIRNRLCDEENLSAKYVIDALRYCGVLTNDSPEYVEGPHHTQEIGKNEETIIIITPYK